MKQENEIQGSIDVAGNVNRLKEDLVTVDPKMDIQQFHLRNIGRLIE